VSEQKIGPDVILHHCITFSGRRYIRIEDDVIWIESPYKGRKKKVGHFTSKKGQSRFSGGFFNQNRPLWCDLIFQNS